MILYILNYMYFKRFSLYFKKFVLFTMILKKYLLINFIFYMLVIFRPNFLFHFMIFSQKDGFSNFRYIPSKLFIPIYDI